MEDLLKKQKTKQIIQPFLTDCNTMLEDTVPSVIQYPLSKDTHDQFVL